MELYFKPDRPEQQWKINTFLNSYVATFGVNKRPGIIWLIVMLFIVRGQWAHNQLARAGVCLLACVSILIEGNRREDSAHIQSIELMSIIISLLISSSQLHAGAAAAACVQLLEVDSRGNKISMARVHRCIIWSPLIHPSSHHRLRPPCHSSSPYTHIDDNC